MPTDPRIAELPNTVIRLERGLKRARERIERLEGLTSPAGDHGNAAHTPDFLIESGYSKGELVVATAAGLFQALAAGADGKVLKALASETLGVEWGDVVAAAHDILSTGHGDTLAAAVVDGDLMAGNVTPKWARLGIVIPAANVRNMLSVENGELRPTWKSDAIYVLLAGRSGGQTIIGSIDAAGNLILQSTAHATKGDILILSGQGLVIGHTGQIDFGATPEFQVLGINTPSSSMGFARFENNASGPDVRFLKSRGATVGSNVIVQDGDILGRFRFQGADTVDFNTTAAEILGKVDGAPSANDIPGKIVFRTRAAGASLSDKAIITEAGQLQVLKTGIAGGLKLGGASQWYNDAGKMRTPDAVTIDGLLTPSGGIANQGKALVFVFPDETLAAAVFMPRPSFRLLSKFPAPTAEANQRFTVTAGTAGASTNTVVLESTTTNPFTGSPSWTIRATAALNALKAAEDTTFGGWTWAPATEWLRVRCTVVNATAPKDVTAYFDYD